MKYSRAIKGLKMLFWGAIVAQVMALMKEILSRVASLPAEAISRPFALVSSIVTLIGVCLLSADCERGKTAVKLAAFSLAFTVLSAAAQIFASESMKLMTAGLSLVSQVLYIILLRVLLKDIGGLCMAFGQYEIDSLGDKVWKLYWACVLEPLALVFVVAIIGVPALQLILLIVGLLAMIGVVIAYLYEYLAFLNRAGKVLIQAQ